MTNDLVINAFLSGREARSSNGNLRSVALLYGLALYNYNTIIAFIVRDYDGCLVNNKGFKFLKLNTDNYSRTTSTIQNKIRRALPGDVILEECDEDDIYYYSHGLRAEPVEVITIYEN